MRRPTTSGWDGPQPRRRADGEPEHRSSGVPEAGLRSERPPRPWRRRQRGASSGRAAWVTRGEAPLRAQTRQPWASFASRAAGAPNALRALGWPRWEEPAADPRRVGRSAGRAPARSGSSTSAQQAGITRPLLAGPGKTTSSTAPATGTGVARLRSRRAASTSTSSTAGASTGHHRGEGTLHALPRPARRHVPRRHRRATLAAGHWASGGFVADYDGDGWQDILVTRSAVLLLPQPRQTAASRTSANAPAFGAPGWNTGAAVSSTRPATADLVATSRPT